MASSTEIESQIVPIDIVMLSLKPTKGICCELFLGVYAHVL